MTCVLNPTASAEIFALAAHYGLVDAYADAPGARFGEYVGTVNGKPFRCTVYDRDPAVDLAALRACVVNAHPPVVSEPVEHRAPPAYHEGCQPLVDQQVANADLVTAEATDFHPDAIDSGSVVEAPEQYSLGFSHPDSLAPAGRKLLSENGQVLSEVER